MMSLKYRTMGPVIIIHTGYNIVTVMTVNDYFRSTRSVAQLSLLYNEDRSAARRNRYLKVNATI